MKHQSGASYTIFVNSERVVPPVWRIIAAFALTPLIAAAALAVVQPLYAGLPNLAHRIYRTTLAYALSGGYPATILLGIPAFLFLRNRVQLTALNCAVTGGVVAAIPWVLLGLFSNPDYAYSNGHVTHESGAKTLWGWVDLATFTGQIAAVGALAGVAFCLISTFGLQRQRKAI
jgi:hypothetical protein